MMTRRFLLAAAAVSTAAAAIPTMPAIAAEAAPAAAPLPAWLVGSDGEFNWLFVRASNAKAAQYAWLSEQGDFVACDELGESAECVCGECFLPSYRRVPELDDKDIATPADWLRADMGTCCSRCGYETFPQEGGQIVG